MNQLDDLIRDTIENIRMKGLTSSVDFFRTLYSFTLSHLDQLKNLSFFQLSGTLFSIISYEKISDLTRFPNMAYYCLTKGVTALQPMGYSNVIQENQMHSRAERAKLLLNGGLKLVEDRLYSVPNMPHQQIYDLSILGDILMLKSLNYNSQELWWHRALEDCEWIRQNYRVYTDEAIIKMGDNINSQIAEQVYVDLKTFANDFGFSNYNTRY